MKKRILKLSAGILTVMLIFSCYTMPVYARFNYTRMTGPSSCGQTPFWLQIAVVILLPAIAVFSEEVVRKKKKKSKQVNAPKDFTAQIVQEAMSWDPDFSSYSVTSRAEKAFGLLTEGTCNRNISALYNVETQELYNRQNTEINDLLSQERIHMLSDIKIISTYLHLYRRDKNYEYITVCINSVMKDYVIDQNNYKVLQGTKEKLVTKFYLMTFMRSKSIINKGKTGSQLVKCPNCGAPIEMNSSRLCDYCHSVIRAEQFDWVLNDVEILGENDKPDNRGILIEDNADVHFTKEKSQYFTGYYDNGIDSNYKDPFEDDDYNRRF